jgi:glycosyltransferase involved in cell wall biosynthesis
MSLGPRWKRKFGVPFVLDIQDPWRNDFYLSRPPAERPPKFFIAYNIDKYLEGRTVPEADGIISVSQGYNDTFIKRYPSLKKEQFRVIPFGIASHDFEVAEKYIHEASRVRLYPDKINIVYIGRGGLDMRTALEIIFKAFKKGLQFDPAVFSRAHFWFIGTSYAPAGYGQKTVVPIATSFDVEDYVTEITDRIPYFETLFLLKRSDILLVPGSSDTTYTASKIYPYIMAKKPLLAVFHQQSSVVDILRNIGFGNVIAFTTSSSLDACAEECFLLLQNMLKSDNRETGFDNDKFAPFTARARAQEQVDFFNQLTN